MSKFEDFLRYYLILVRGDSVTSSKKSLDIVDSLCFLRINISTVPSWVGFEPTILPLERLTPTPPTGELEFPLLSGDCLWSNLSVELISNPLRSGVGAAMPLIMDILLTVVESFCLS